MERSPAKAPQEVDVTQAKVKLDFDDNTLRAITEKYKNEGNDAYKRRDFNNAVYFYTEGIKVNCKDDELNAKLYSNRATAHFYLGKYQESLNDASAAVELQPTYIKAIVRGASACVELHLYEEAIIWCDKGLAINKNTKTLSDLKSRSVKELNKLKQTKQGEVKAKPQYPIVKGQKSNSFIATEYGDHGNAHDSLGDLEKAIDYHKRCLELAKEKGDNIKEEHAYAGLGNAYHSLGDFRKAIDYHTSQLNIAKYVGNRRGEGRAYAGLGKAFFSLGNFEKSINYQELCLKIAKEVEDKAGEGRAYGDLGKIYHRLGDFKKAIEHHELHLKIAKEVAPRLEEGGVYGALGVVYDSLGDFYKAIEYHNRHLQISKEEADKTGEGHAYCNLGCAYHNLKDFQKAIECHELQLSIAKQVGDKVAEGRAYGNLGIAYTSIGDFDKAVQNYELDLQFARQMHDILREGQAYENLGRGYQCLGDFTRALEYHHRHLQIAKQLEDRATEGRVYGNLGCAFSSIGDFKKNMFECYEKHLTMAKATQDKAQEAIAYGNLGYAYDSIGDLKKGLEYHELDLKIAKEVGDLAREGLAYANLGSSFELLGNLHQAVNCYQSSVKALNEVRALLQSKDEWKISLRDMHQTAYTSLWRLLLKQGKEVEALFAAEQGRAQALKDLMESKYGLPTDETRFDTKEEAMHDILSSIPCNTVFTTLSNDVINFWVIQSGKQVCRTVKEVERDPNTKDDVITSVRKLIRGSFWDIGVRTEVDCEDRSLDKLRKPSLATKSSDQTGLHSLQSQHHRMRRLYDFIVDPIADLIRGDEIIIVPEGPLWWAPYAAFMDSNSKHLSETFRIRVIPSLTSLKLILDSPTDYHSKTGALLVGDPWVQDVINNEGQKLDQLPYARREVEMIGRILNTAPLTGKEATKNEVLKRLSTIALVHIAAHGRMETGEIALCPNPSRASRVPKDEDFLLTISDVMNVNLAARLVVLSCCHSGRGEIKAEGVVGIARAFLGAGARSVLVSLWAIDDEATLEFMKYFYQHLVEGKSAGEALNQAMKCMRESQNFGEVKYWAPFVLIGDDVTLEFAGSD